MRAEPVVGERIAWPVSRALWSDTDRGRELTVKSIGALKCLHRRTSTATLISDRPRRSLLALGASTAGQPTTDVSSAVDLG